MATGLGHGVGRRRLRQAPLSARLQVDRGVAAKGEDVDVGSISRELLARLFRDEEPEDDDDADQDDDEDGGDSDAQGEGQSESSRRIGSPRRRHRRRRDVYHVAIAPWRPTRTTSVQVDLESPWSIVPVRPLRSIDRLTTGDVAAAAAAAAATTATATPSNVLRLPASSIYLQGLAAALQREHRDARSSGDGSGSEFDILVLDVEPLGLETVFIQGDGEALRRHEEVQRKFAGGFFASQANGGISTSGSGIGSGSAGGKGKGKARLLRNGRGADWKEGKIDEELEDSLIAAAREALKRMKVVHSDDRLLLPLPAHPVTHVPFPPVQVVLCEPVAQGVITDDTNIVLDFQHRPSGNNARAMSHLDIRPLGRTIAEDEEDASTEQFFSAVENEENGGINRQRGLDSPARQNIITDDDNEDEDDDDDSNSDDSSSSGGSTDNTISLSSPTLPYGGYDNVLSKSASTPRPRGDHAPGVSSPGSVFSSYTAMSARPGGYPGRRFDVKILSRKIPDHLLQPRPGPGEDDDARAFVDIKLLVRLGCFSGDWVKVSVIPRSENGLGKLSFEVAPREDGEVETSRPVRIFGLAELGHEDGPQYPKTEYARRMSQGSTVSRARPRPTVYVNPVLFVNLNKPDIVTMAPLSSIAQKDKRFARSKIAGSGAPPVAKEVTLMKVPTPLSTDRAVQHGLLVNLKHHFENRRRILQKGDLIPVRMDPQTSQILFDPENGAEPDPSLDDLLIVSESDTLEDKGSMAVAWFKVGQISGNASSNEDQHGMDSAQWGEAALIEPSTTRMVQSGNAPGKLPPSKSVPWQTYLGVKMLPKRSLLPESPFSTLQSFPSNVAVTPTQSRIVNLLAASTSPQAIRLKLSPIIILLHSTQRRAGKYHVASAACDDLGLHLFVIDAYDILIDESGGEDVKTEATLRARAERALSCGAQYTILMIQHAEALTADRMGSALADLSKDFRATILTTNNMEELSEGIRDLCTHEIGIHAPDDKEREGILRSVVDQRGFLLAPDVDLGSVALKTAALVAGNLVDVVDRARASRDERVRELAASKTGVLERDVLVSGGAKLQCLTKADLESAVETARKTFADSIGAPKIPNVTWEDVGGLAHAKDALMETIQLPLEHPELFTRGLRKRSGILFYGPPGTGKTLLAKAIATEFSLNFFSVKGPELLNMYIGESEANVRRVFQKARDARPCVVFFDELDSVAPKRGNQGDSGGVMDRIVSQLLAELDGMSGDDGGAGSSGSGSSNGNGVFVIGATNRPDLLDQALLRPGRFDKMLYLGVADTHDKQRTILEALTRRFALHEDLSLARVAEALPFTYTGADLYALCSDAMLKAIARKAEAVDAKIAALPEGPVSHGHFFDRLATDEDVAVEVTEADFRAAQGELVSSVSAKELEHYQRVRRAFEGFSIESQSSKSGAASGANRASSPPRQLMAALDVPGKTVGRTLKSAAGRAPGEKQTATDRTWSSSTDGEEEDDDDDDAYVTSNDYGTPSRYRSTNGSAKGKTPVYNTHNSTAEAGENGFGEAGNDDDLYDD